MVDHRRIDPSCFGALEHATREVRVQAKYVKYSVCECGFPALKVGTPMGKLYTAETESVRPISMQCGGCGKILDLKFITVSDGVQRPGPLPIDIFEFDEGNLN